MEHTEESPEGEEGTETGIEKNKKGNGKERGRPTFKKPSEGGRI